MSDNLTAAQRAQANALIETSVSAPKECHNADEWDEAAIDRLMADVHRDQVKRSANRICDLAEENSILKKDLRFWKWFSLCATVLAASLMAGIVGNTLWGR